MRNAVVAVWLLAGCADPTSAEGPDGGVDASSDGSPMPDMPSAEQLLMRVSACDEVVGGPYAPGSGRPEDISICGFPNAVVWQADMDIDCDGKLTAQCNPQTDPFFMDQTAATDSNGDPLDSAALPFVVVPGRGTRFDFREAGLAMGTVVAVIYDGKVEYGPLGDVGPVAIIGEASYRMAELLGIDPDPSTGGIEGGVTYIAFTGDSAKLEVIEDHAEATRVGVERARDLLATP